MVHLFDADRAKIDEQGWVARLGVPPYLRLGRQTVLNKHSDGACVFLNAENQCSIHARFGEAAKPIACRMFPFSVRRVRVGWQASLRFDCPSVAESRGAGLTSHQTTLEATVRGFESTHRPADVAVALKHGRIATRIEQDALGEAVVRVLRDDSIAVDQRLIGLARVTATLAECNLAKVREERFAELVEILSQTLPSEAKAPTDPPGQKQGRLFRQLVFAHTEHVSLAQLRSRWPQKLGIRVGQLIRSRAFARGVGIVPPLPGCDGTATFEGVDAVLPDAADAGLIAEVWQRYLLMRVGSQSVFGAGYHGWPMLAGFSALWLAIAATGYVARWSAAADGRTSWGHDDLVWAIGVIDRTATRAPALGTLTERARIRALRADDGVARLLNRYAMTAKRPS